MDGKYIFEIGGKNKPVKQIGDLTDAFVVMDDIENGAFNQIPLWIFGFLIVAFRSYFNFDFDIRYWRTKSGLEVDFILRDGEIAIEVKGTKRIDQADLKGILAFQKELQPRKCIVVCNEASERKAGEIDIMPYRSFLRALWEKGIIA